jgi:S1-C subfamily serine protease
MSRVRRRFVNIVNAVSPAVVQIRTALALGSGVVFDARDDVVTNAHVVDNATRSIDARNDGKGRVRLGTERDSSARGDTRWTS